MDSKFNKSGWPRRINNPAIGRTAIGSISAPPMRCRLDSICFMLLLAGAPGRVQARNGLQGQRADGFGGFALQRVCGESGAVVDVESCDQRLELGDDRRN